MQNILHCNQQCIEYCYTIQNTTVFESVTIMGFYTNNSINHQSKILNKLVYMCRHK